MEETKDTEVSLSFILHCSSVSLLWCDHALWAGTYMLTEYKYEKA